MSGYVQTGHLRLNGRTFEGVNPCESCICVVASLTKQSRLCRQNYIGCAYIYMYVCTSLELQVMYV